MYEYLHPHKLYRSATHADSAQQKQRISAASLEVSGRKAELVQRLRDSPMVLMPTNQDAGSCPPAKKQQLIISHARRSVLVLMLSCCTCAYGEAIAPLVALVRDGTDEQKYSAAFALENLAHSDDNKIAIAKAGGIHLMKRF